MLRIICILVIHSYHILPYSNDNSENLFSILKRTKNCLRSSLTQKKISDLSILIIESEIVKGIKCEKLVRKCTSQIEEEKYLLNIGFY